MDLLLRAGRAVDALNARVGRLAAWLTLAMVLIGAGNALARYSDRSTGLGLSSNAWIEAQWYLFSLVFLFGAPWALRTGGHVRVDVLYGRLGLRARAWIDLVGGLVLLIPFCVFALVVSWPSVAESIAIRELSPDPGGLPRWPLKACVPAAFALLLLQGLSEVVKRWALLAGRDLHELGLADETREGGHA
jgi:TRAP-type mannitol/chloroaromatic compound transport system permease small subunit